MTEPNNPPEFYVARDAVMSRAYIKMRTGILHRYINVLSKQRPWENMPECAPAAMMKAEWLAKLKMEIDIRKEKRREVAADIAKKVAGGLIIAGIIALITWVFSFWPFGRVSVEKEYESVEQGVAPYAAQGAASGER